jgi:hypothetical protein
MSPSTLNEVEAPPLNSWSSVSEYGVTSPEPPDTVIAPELVNAIVPMCPDEGSPNSVFVESTHAVSVTLPVPVCVSLKVFKKVGVLALKFWSLNLISSAFTPVQPDELEQDATSECRSIPNGISPGEWLTPVVALIVQPLKSEIVRTPIVPALGFTSPTTPVQLPVHVLGPLTTIESVIVAVSPPDEIRSWSVVVPKAVPTMSSDAAAPTQTTLPKNRCIQPSSYLMDYHHLYTFVTVQASS